MYSSAKKILDANGLKGYRIILKTTGEGANIVLHKCGKIAKHWHNTISKYVWCYTYVKNCEVFYVEICEDVVKMLNYPKVIGIFDAE